MEYFECEIPSGVGYCSDDSCPCGYPGAVIPPGGGYIYISQQLIDFRKDARSLQEARRKIERMKQQTGSNLLLIGPGVAAPILMCEQGARRRGLDLEVAAVDAKHWWKTGRVPLRPTPLAK
jgi:hypothetical protein